MDWTELMAMSGGFEKSRILHTAVDFGLFDQLEPGGATAGELAQKTGLNARTLEILLNALVGLELLEKRQDGFLNSDATKRYLLASSPTYFGHYIRFNSFQFQHWDRLHQVLQTGRPVHEPDAFQTRPEETSLFIMAMHDISLARGDATILPERLDLSRYHTFLDLGGGPGTFAMEFCRKYPDLRAVVFDLPGSVNITRELVKRYGMEHHIELVAGDYTRDELPQCDVAFLSNIIHGDDEATNKALMEKVSRALSPGGQVIIKDHILDESRTQPPLAAAFAVMMLLFTRGRCYTFSEVKAWLEQAGLEHAREVPPEPPLTSSLVLAQKPGARVP